MSRDQLGPHSIRKPSLVASIITFETNFRSYDYIDRLGFAFAFNKSPITANKKPSISGQIFSKLSRIFLRVWQIKPEIDNAIFDALKSEAIDG